VNLPLGVAQGWLQPRISSPRPTLDGRAFLEEEDRQTWFLTRALQGMAGPRDAVTEAAKLAYSDYTRIAMHTGQPTVVGWPWHLQQRGQARSEIQARYQDLETLYAGTDPVARREVLDRYNVRWVVVAELERRTYDMRKDDPMAGVPGLALIAEHDGASLYRVQPVGTMPMVSVVRPAHELPPSVRAVGTVPVVSTAAVRALAIDQQGATVVLRDGSVMAMDGLGRAGGEIAEAPCDLSSVARRDGVLWAGCADGGAWLLDGNTWRRFGTVAGAPHLTVGSDLWAWGSSGLWRYESADRWRNVSTNPVIAAAANGPAVAVSDGESVVVRQGRSRRRVGARLGRIRSLAWQGPTLWAQTDEGLYRSGGAVLGWRRTLDELDDVSALAGSDDRLWLVLDSGLIVQHTRAGCESPWTGRPGERSLSQPRGVVVSPDGWFAVTDTLNDRVKWFTLQGTCLDQVGEEGVLPGSFQEPTGLALSEGGTLAVADTWNGRVQLIRPNGSVQVVGQNLYGPRGVMWVEDRSLLVADTGNKTLLRFRAPRWEREELYRFDEPLVGLARVGGLVAVALPAAGEVVLLDPQSWSELRRLSVPGWHGGTQQEGYLAALPSGELLASAPTPGELWLLDPQGSKPPVRVATQLPGVTGIALLPDGRLLAAQTYENRIVKVDL
jgi:sugar lactone lactonase YvrE